MLLFLQKAFLVVLDRNAGIISKELVQQRLEELIVFYNLSFKFFDNTAKASKLAIR